MRSKALDPPKCSLESCASNTVTLITAKTLQTSFFAQETNQSHALHFSKGCYLGQEIVERVRARAQLHRRLMPLDIDGATAPAPGTRLTTQGDASAEITSAAFSPALAKVVALAYVRTV